MRRWQGAHLSPGVLIEVEGPDGRVVQIDFAKPLPTMTMAKRREPKIAAHHGIEYVLLSAADARRAEIGLEELPAGASRLEGPHFGVLFSAASLIVPTVSDEP